MAPAPHDRVSFSELSTCDLIVDAVYEGGTKGGYGDDPIGRILGVGNAGGFRISGPVDAPTMVALCTSGVHQDWPDRLDPETGQFTYFGDNRSPGKGLLETSHKGNLLLTNVFGWAHGSKEERQRVPPFFVFESTREGRNNRFLGLAVPGAAEAEVSEDLVAIWRTTDGQRFQNYRSTFTILDVGQIDRAWIEELQAGDRFGAHCPSAFKLWVEEGLYRPLRAPRTIFYRTKEEQLPQNSLDIELLRRVHEFFADDPYQFEECAAYLWMLQHGSTVNRLQVTRKSVDGGRDAVGSISIGPTTDPISLDFALEAKCYSPGANSVGVKEVSRLISRLRHRQFGVLVTTSYVSKQAYVEIREDEHPVVIMSGIDIVNVLRAHGHWNHQSLVEWLSQDFSKTLTW
jgi:hypothetical protein